MENLYNYTKLAKTNPQKALTDLNDWLDSHCEWLNNYANLSEAQNITSRPDDIFRKYDSDFKDDTDCYELSDFNSKDTNDLKGMLNTLKVYKHYNNAYIWLNHNNKPVSSKEAIKAIVKTGKKINHDNLTLPTDKSDPEYDEQHQGKKVFYYKTSKMQSDM